MQQIITEAQQKTLDNTEVISTSNRYNNIQTSAVMERFREHGFTLSKYAESNYRKAEKAHKVRHYVRMHLDTVNGVSREAVIMNSHDSSTSLRLHFGVTRLVCNNGLVLSSDIIPEERIRHTAQNAFERIDTFIETLKSQLDQEVLIREAMEVRQFSFEDMMQFAHEAIKIRESDLNPILDPNDLMTVQRPEDLDKNLWITFNKAQENLVLGNYRKLGIQTDNETGKTREIYKKAKELRAPNELIRVNKELHELAMKYL